MSYKALMVHVDLEDAGNGRVRIAAELAQRLDAALIGISAWAPNPAITVDSVVPEPAPDLVDLPVMEELLKARGDTFRALAGQAVRQVEWRSALELPTEFVVRQARSADLLIVGGTAHPVLRDPYRSVDPGAVLLRAGRPILVVPPEVTSLAAKRIAVAWKDTREARRAIVDALPLLRKAEAVAIVEFCGSGEQASAQQRLKDVGQYLARHGVNTAAEQARPIDATVTNSLLQLARTESIDLVVAGGYGHTRLGEWIFGGVTHDLLVNGSLCCLLSH
jgi:nucleotide-binding universal stress UspA family protein